MCPEVMWSTAEGEGFEELCDPIFILLPLEVFHSKRFSKYSTTVWLNIPTDHWSETASKEVSIQSYQLFLDFHGRSKNFLGGRIFAAQKK